MSYTKLFLAPALALLVVFAPGRALAQRAPDDGFRVYNEQLRVKLDQQQASAHQQGLDAGGWFSYAFFNFNDEEENRTRVLDQYSMWLWGSYTIDGVHTAYVRGVMNYNDWYRGDSFDGQGDQFNQPALDRAWYKFDYNRLVRNQTGANPELGGSVTVGRDWETFGTGLALALPLDAVRVVATLPQWEATGLLGKTITHTSNLDQSIAVQDHMDRCFWGGQLTYTGFDRDRPFAYFLSQDDHTQPWGGDDDQRYGYDSNYMGIGSTGGFAKLPGLRYSGEAVLETGHGFTFNTNRSEEIQALGLDAQLEYIFDVPRHPRLMGEYLFGSGDANRDTSATSAIGGNLRGKDTAFNAFGYRDTGIAFAPTMANLSIWQLGAAILPLEQIDLFRRMEVGTKAYLYVKNEADGPISDTLGTEHHGYAGWEWDVYMNWRITSDLSFTIRYGLFFPGEAFEERDDRHFLYSGFTYSF
jgi:hypothetical protein